MAPRFTVVVPTHERREQVVKMVRALATQSCEAGFEVIVVVDGSSDRTADALRSLDCGVPLEVVEQERRGAAAARNLGAARARGEILLFLDDDMEADRHLLAEHDRSHRAGAEVVLGHIPLHPESPANLVSRAVGEWAADRARVLSEPDRELTFYDLLIGQMSVTREAFERLGGFDERFTRGGTYGDEDVDFAQRILDLGLRVVFNPAAESRQRYLVTPREHLRQWRQTGAADVELVRKHPARAAAIFGARGTGTLAFRLLWRPLLELPGVAALLCAASGWSASVVARAPEGPLRGVRSRWLRTVRNLHYWRGVRESGGIPRPRAVRVLSYHAVADLAGDPVLGRYGVPPHVFRLQLATLRRAGFRLVTPGELLRALGGSGGLPRRPVLLTFDDCYEDLHTEALPVLAQHDAAAIAFAVSGRLGRTNDWDAEVGAREIRLLDAGELRELAAAGVEIGAHSRSHRRLDRLPADELRAEVAGSLADLERLGLGRPRFFAYPYGEQDARAREAVREAEVKAAFTTEPGLVRPGDDPLRLRRIEIGPEDVGWRLVLRLLRSGLSPFPRRG